VDRQSLVLEEMGYFSFNRTQVTPLVRHDSSPTSQEVIISSLPEDGKKIGYLVLLIQHF
jgi:hypothetical protein